MPAVLPSGAIENADAAVSYAQQVRRFHRRRTSKTSEQRVKELALAMDRLHDAMKPLRTEIGRFQYGPQTPTAEANRQTIRDASAAIQAERRKLWKMQKRSEKK